MAKSPELDVWLPSRLERFLNIECTLKNRHMQGLLFFPPLARYGTHLHQVVKSYDI